MLKSNGINYIKLDVASPEKAGVGGSIPSLATIIPKDLHGFTDFLQPKAQPRISLHFLRQQAHLVFY